MNHEHNTPFTALPGTAQAPDLRERLSKIRLLALDVDGVMTDGRLFWLNGHGWTRHFHIRDGYGIKLLMKGGIQVAIISGGESEDVRTRAEHLKITHLFLGDEDKLKALDRIVKTTGFSPEQIAFMGDELFDLPVLERVGFSASVPHAVQEVKSKVHYVTHTDGGWGAVREVADAIRKAQGIGPFA